MKMIKLSDSVYVSSSAIADVQVRYYEDGVNVTMKDGRVHSVANDYGKGPYRTLDRLVKEINEAEKNNNESD